MTALEALVRDLVPQQGTTGWRIADAGSGMVSLFAVVPIIDWRADGAPIYRGSLHACQRLVRMLEAA